MMFNVDPGRAIVYFTNPSGITSIFSHMTGTEGSNIFSKVRAEQSRWGMPIGSLD